MDGALDISSATEATAAKPADATATVDLGHTEVVPEGPSGDEAAPPVQSLAEAAVEGNPADGPAPVNQGLTGVVADVPSSEEPLPPDQPAAAAAADGKAKLGNWFQATLHGWPRLLLTGLILAGSCLAAWILRGTFDDGFVYLRVAENLADGHGMVYNPGEPHGSEATADFLWTLLLAALIKVGFAPFTALQALGMLCVVGNLVVIHNLARRLWPQVPLAALLALTLLGTHYSFLAFSTGGYGHALLSLVLLLCLMALHDHCRQPRSGIVLGCALGLLVLTRLDSVLLAVPLLAVAAWHALFVRGTGFNEVPRSLVVAALVPLSILAALLLFKLLYYGYMLPPAYHTRLVTIHGITSVFDYYWQGFTYLFAYHVRYGFIVLLAVAGYAYLRQGRKRTRRPWWTRPRQLVLMAAVGTAVIGQAYAWRLGGGDLGFRLLLPQAPVLMLVIAGGLGHLRLWQAVTGLLVAVGLSVFHGVTAKDNLELTERKVTAASLEHRYLPVEHVTLDSLIAIGKALNSLFTDLGELTPSVRFATAEIGAIGYFSRLHGLELQGLTDLEVAGADHSYLWFYPNEPLGEQQTARPRLLHLMGINFVVYWDTYKNDHIDFSKTHFVLAGVESPHVRWAHLISHSITSEPIELPDDAQLFALPVAGRWVTPVLYLTRSPMLDARLDAMGIERVDVFTAAEIEERNAPDEDGG